MPSSSSTMSMLAMISSVSSTCLGGNSHFGGGEPDQEPRARGHVVFDANRAVMFGDNATGNRQAQSRAASFGRKMGQKQLFFVLRRDSVAAIRNFDDDGVSVAFRSSG